MNLFHCSSAKCQLCVNKTLTYTNHQRPDGSEEGFGNSVFVGSLSFEFRANVFPQQVIISGVGSLRLTTFHHTCAVNPWKSLTRILHTNGSTLLATCPSNICFRLSSRAVFMILLLSAATLRLMGKAPKLLPEPERFCQLRPVIMVRARAGLDLNDENSTWLLCFLPLPRTHTHTLSLLNQDIMFVAETAHHTHTE